MSRHIHEKIILSLMLNKENLMVKCLSLNAHGNVFSAIHQQITMDYDMDLSSTQQQEIRIK